MFYNFFYISLLMLLLYIKMSEIADLIYYQKTRNVTLNKAKDYYKNNKERLKNREEIDTEAYLQKKKVKRENTGRIGIIIYLKKRNRD